MKFDTLFYVFFIGKVNLRLTKSLYIVFLMVVFVQIIIVLPLTQLFSKTIVEKASTTMKKTKIISGEG